MPKGLTFRMLAATTVLSLVLAGCAPPSQQPAPQMGELPVAPTETPVVEEYAPPVPVLIPMTGDELASLNANTGGVKNRVRVSTLAGRVNAIAQDFWTINHRHILVTPQTEINGPIQRGDYVVARLQKTNAGLVALAIQFDHPGPIEVVDNGPDEARVASRQPRPLAPTPPRQDPTPQPTSQPPPASDPGNPGSDQGKNADKNNDKGNKPDKGKDKDKDKGKDKDKNKDKDKRKGDGGKGSKGGKGKGNKDLLSLIPERQQINASITQALQVAKDLSVSAFTSLTR